MLLLCLSYEFGALTSPVSKVKSLAGCHGPHYSVREIFVKARQMAPCLLVFEDLDSMITDKVKSFFLNEVDGLESNDGIMMIGSTNYRTGPLLFLNKDSSTRVAFGLMEELVSGY